MLLFTQHGYFSIVADGDDRTHVVIRARAIEHLVNIIKNFEVDATIFHTLNADYPFNLRIKRQRWLSLAQDLAADVRYTNFETATSKNSDRVLPRYVQVVRKVHEGMAVGMAPLRGKTT